MEVEIHALLTSGLVEVESSDLPSDLTRGKEALLYLLVRRLGRPQFRSGPCREDKLLPLPEIETPFPASPMSNLLKYSHHWFW